MNKNNNKANQVWELLKLKEAAEKVLKEPSEKTLFGAVKLRKKMPKEFKLYIEFKNDYDIEAKAKGYYFTAQDIENSYAQIREDFINSGILDRNRIRDNTLLQIVVPAILDMEEDYKNKDKNPMHPNLPITIEKLEDEEDQIDKENPYSWQVVTKALDNKEDNLSDGDKVHKIMAEEVEKSRQRSKAKAEFEEYKKNGGNGKE